MTSKRKPDALIGQGNPSASGSKLQTHDTLKNTQSHHLRFFTTVLVVGWIACSALLLAIVPFAVILGGHPHDEC